MYKRFVSIIVIVSIITGGVVGRIGFITLSNNYAVDKTYNSYLVNLDKLYTNFYYSNGLKINNNTKQLVAIIEPDEKCIGELDLLFDSRDKSEIISELKKGYPVVRKIKEYVKLKYIKIEEINNTDNNFNQLINKSSKGFLYYEPQSIGKLCIKYNIDARGKIINNSNYELLNDNYNSGMGYKLTINKKIQEITYSACKDLDNGCALVLDVDSFDVLSYVVKPDNSYLNKPLLLYNPGSIFKIVVAICALENGIDLEYNCIGKITVGDTEFGCQKNKSHNNQRIKEALANSCNCYFVNLANYLGKEKILETINKLGFYESTSIFNDWKIENSKIPSENDLKSNGELSLLGFGQGKLLVSPIQMARLLCVIANDGYITEPTFIKSRITSNNTELIYPNKSRNKVLTDSSCRKMMEYLTNVVENGTGKRAQSLDKQSLGKTATAQTGQFKDGKEILNTWFIGLYPASNPKYAIVIMKENGTSGSQDCCPIFSTIVDNLPK